MTRVLISGYYGYGNLGDEAILAATAAMFRAKAPDVELLALSANPANTEHWHGVRAVPRFGLSTLWASLKSADLFLQGGGGLLQDVTSWRSPLYYTGQLVAARLAGTPAMLWAQGIGPLTGAFARQTVRLALKGVAAGSVRDAESVAELQRLGMPADRIALTADPVLMLPPADPSAADPILTQAGLDPRRPFIAIAIRPWQSWYERQLKSFTAVISQLANQEGVQVLMVAFQHSVDRHLADEAAYCIGSRPAGAAPRVGALTWPISAPEMMAVLGRAQFVVGMRLHSLIMAAAMGVPALGLVYDPKVEAFSQLAGYPYLNSIGALSEGETWSRTLFQAWQSQDGQRRFLSQRLPELQAAAWQNVDLALRLLGRA